VTVSTLAHKLEPAPPKVLASVAAVCGLAIETLSQDAAMGYYMRFISTDDREITLSILEQALLKVDPRYSINAVGELRHAEDLYGLIQIDLLDECDEEIAELKEDVEEARGTRRAEVIKTLDEARTMVAVQVLWQGRETEPTLLKIDPLWDWLFSHRKGLQHADGEGYYDRSGLILQVR
jgi:hypothetical protein